MSTLSTLTHFRIRLTNKREKRDMKTDVPVSDLSIKNISISCRIRRGVVSVLKNDAASGRRYTNDGSKDNQDGVRSAHYTAIE